MNQRPPAIYSFHIFPYLSLVKLDLRAQVFVPLLRWSRLCFPDWGIFIIFVSWHQFYSDGSIYRSVYRYAIFGYLYFAVAIDMT